MNGYDRLISSCRCEPYIGQDLADFAADCIAYRYPDEEIEHRKLETNDSVFTNRLISVSRKGFETLQFLVDYNDGWKTELSNFIESIDLRRKLEILSK